MAVANYKDEIIESNKLLKDCIKDKSGAFLKEKEVLELVKTRYKMLYSQIHEYLAPKKNDYAEDEILEHIKSIWSLDILACESKISRFKRAISDYERKGNDDGVELCYRYLQEWLILYENFQNLIAFRDLTTFCNIMEYDKKDKDKVWKYSIDPYNDGGYTGVNKGFFYYFNQMVLKRNIKFISKQQSTGTGKSHSNHYAIAWLLGIDPDNDILIVLGNPALVLTNIRTIVELMKKPRFCKIFPQYEKYLEITEDKKGNKVETVSDNIFSVCRAKEGELTLADSNKPVNIKVISKDTPIDGIRVRFLFLDDVCRSKDAGNMKQHETDISNFWNSWWKRNYNTEDFYIVLGCTAYSIFDIASQLISYFSKGKMIRSAVNKYSYLSLDNKCVFIKVPKIDEELNRSTYPQKFSYEEAIKIKERDYRSFMAMEQQQPMPPENSPFYVENLNGYDVIPEEDRSEFCWASLDTARVGYDYNSMPIFVKVGDKFYLKDCLYLNEPMEKVYGKIVEKIIQHKITKLVIEKNIDTSLKALLDKMLAEQDINYCEIIEVYATIKKEEKIYNMENTIKNNIVFPNMHLYSYSSQMGKFMNDVFSFSYTHKNEHDDSIDSIATFCQRMIVMPTAKTKAKLLHI